jgi:hypothetical protein
MSDFVRDYVLRQTRENELAREIPALPGFVRREVAKQNSLRLRAVVGVGLPHGVRVKLEDPDIAGLAESIFLVWGTSEAIGSAPVNLSPQGYFKHLDGTGRDGINHLLMKTGIRFRWIETIVGEQQWVVEIDRRIVTLVCRIVVDDRDFLPRWPWVKWFPRNPHGNLISRVPA